MWMKQVRFQLSTGGEEGGRGSWDGMGDVASGAEHLLFKNIIILTFKQSCCFPKHNISMSPILLLFGSLMLKYGHVLIDKQSMCNHK